MATRSTSASPAGSSAMSCLTLSAARSVRLTNSMRSWISIRLSVATSRAASRIPAGNFVTDGARFVERFSSDIVSEDLLLSSGRHAVELAALPDLRAVRAGRPGVDDRDVVRLCAEADPAHARAGDPVRVRRLHRAASHPALHDQLLPDGA